MAEIFLKAREKVTHLECLQLELNKFQQQMQSHSQISEKYFDETTKIIHDKTVKA